MNGTKSIKAGLLGAATAVLAMALWASPARADGKGKAHMLIKKAKHSLSEARCHVQSCPEIFLKAEASYEKAVKLDPSPKTALAHCRLYGDLHSSNDKLAVKKGLAHKALARCDYAANHPDSDDDTRDRARSGGRDLRNIIEMERTKEENVARLIASAKALYGVGLKMKYDKKAGKITLDYGKLDEKTLQEYISEYWAGYAYDVLRVAINENDMLNPGQRDHFDKIARKGVFAWVMAEPMAKFKICKKLMYHVTSKDLDISDWCLFQSLIEANAPLFAFRGEPVSWDVKQTEGGGLSLDERIFMPNIDGVYKPTITIAGPVEIDDYKHITLTKAIAYKIRSSSKYYQDMLGISARAEKIDKKAKKAYAKKDKKLGGKKGKVVFSTKSFVGWDMPPILSKKAPVPDCDVLNYKAYAPRKKGRDYEFDIKVDGETCNVGPLSSSKHYSFMHPEYGGDRNDQCQKALLVPGEHKIKIDIFEVKASKTGRKQINRDWTVGDEYMAYRGGKKASGATKCTTKGSGSGAGSRFE
jgi:hypothetical protein